MRTLSVEDILEKLTSFAFKISMVFLFQMLVTVGVLLGVSPKNTPRFQVLQYFLGLKNSPRFSAEGLAMYAHRGYRSLAVGT